MSTTAAMSALKHIQARIPGYVLAEEMYEGDRAEVFASEKLRRALKATSTTFKLPIARIPVDAVLNRLELSAILSTDKQAVAAIDEIWSDNELYLEGNEFHRRGLVFGEAYVFVWPDPEDETRIEVSYQSPKMTMIQYDPRKPMRKLYGAQAWQREDGRTRIDLYYPDRIERYVSKKKNPTKEEQLEQYLDSEQEEWMLENPYGEVPFFHFRTQKPHGRPEHKDAFGPQDMVNKLAITQMAAADFQGFPQRYLLAGNKPSSDGEDYDEELDDSVEQPTLKSGPGELWWLEGDNLEVGQFQTADAKNFLEPIQKYIEAAAIATQTPLSFFKGMAGAPSGEARKVEQSSLVKKTEDRQLSFGQTWRSLYSFALRLKGVTDTDVQVQWLPAESNDTSDDWTTAKLKQELGLPFDRVLKELGYGDDDIQSFAQDQPDLFLAAKISEIAQRLAMAVSSGVMTPDEAKALLRPDPESDSEAA